MPTPNWIGYTLGGRYKIEALLGQGGMSAVYKGADPNLRRNVAIKLIHAHLASDPEFVRRFETEASAVAQLRHPNIVQVFDFNHDGDTYFMVLEYVTGESLQEKLRSLHSAGRRLPLEEIIRLLTAVCDAVHYAHERGLIHRDLKPANVMLNAQGQPILMDFGIAKIVGAKQFTATGAVIGTPAYISPEQVRGQRPDKRADIYALGVMLFEMLAGQLPFEADSAMSLMMKHVSEPVPDLRQLAPHVPRPLIAVVERALEKDPARRFQSAADLALALHAASTGQHQGAIPESTPPNRASKSRLALVLGGAAIGLCGLMAVAAISTFMLCCAPPFTPPGLPSSSPNTSPETPGTAVAQVTPTEVQLTSTDVQFNTPTASATPTVLPSPTSTPTPTTQPASPTVTPATFFARLTGIRIENGRYVVDFQTTNYQSQLPGMHIHLFFNTVPPERAGVPGAGPWYVHGAGSPVSPYAVSQKPPNASQMCILVANPDHSIILNSGNCLDLPQS